MSEIEKHISEALDRYMNATSPEGFDVDDAAYDIKTALHASGFKIVREKEMGRVKDEIIERESNIVFERGVDECENPAFFWTNPWSGNREKVATLFWPTHPFEETERIEDLWDLLELRIAPPTPEQGEYVRTSRATLRSVREDIQTYIDEDGGIYPLEMALESLDNALAAQREEG